MTQTSLFESSCAGVGRGKEKQRRPQKPQVSGSSGRHFGTEEDSGTHNLFEMCWRGDGCSGERGHPSLCSGGQRVSDGPSSIRCAELCQNILSAVPKHPLGCAHRALFLTGSVRNGSRQPAAVLPSLPSNLPRSSTP